MMNKTKKLFSTLMLSATLLGASAGTLSAFADTAVPAQPPTAQTSSTSTSASSASGVKEYSSDTTTSGLNLTATAADQSGVEVTGGNVNLSKLTVSKIGNASSTDNSNFTGVNAGILANNAGTLTLKNSKVTTNASGANGIFAYGKAVANISNTTISTTKDNSGGIEVAGGGTIKATNLTINTQGNHSAAIRSDRGGGTETVNKGTYTTNGTGSPAVYSTAKVSVSNAKLTANNSEAIVIEGLNSVNLTNDTVTGNMTSSASTTDNIHNVMIYQSMSGDATTGAGTFTMTGGSLTAKAGDMFYVTNTTANISLNNVKLTNSSTGNLLTVSGNDGSRGWGTAGSNGATVTMTATKQTMKGAIVVDSISSLNLSLKSGSSFTGTINASGSAGKVNVTLDSSSKWVLTGDSHLTSFTGSTKNIVANGHHVYVNGKAIV